MFNQVINSLIAIFSGNAYTNIEINNTIKQNHFTDNEKKLYTKLVYGVVENKLLIDYLLNPLTKGKRIKPYLKNALRLGAYALDNLNLAPHYVICELVEEIKRHDYKASTFANAILRKYQLLPRRSLDSLELIDYYSIKYSLPKDLAVLLLKQYPNDFQNFFANNSKPINTYRINNLKAKKEEVISFLDKEGISFQIEKDVILKTTSSLVNSSLFSDGKIVAQDKSSILVGLVASPKKQTKILDACSAPGMKAMHLASIIENDGSILATDIYEHKLNLISENAKKLGVTCLDIKLLDASNAFYQDDFALILVDAPCSGLGVIRHKPDLKYQMTLEKIAAIKKTQQAILNNVAKYLQKDGILVYSTCTINQEENEEMIEAFLKNHPNFVKEKEIKVLPSSDEDGFYICRLRGN